MHAHRLGVVPPGGQSIDIRRCSGRVREHVRKISGKIYIVELERYKRWIRCALLNHRHEQQCGVKWEEHELPLEVLGTMKRHRCCIRLSKNVLRFTVGMT